MLPARYAPLLFGLIVSGLMSAIVSGHSTFRTIGTTDGFVAIWLNNWPASWAVAFPTILVVAPVVRRFVARLTSETA